MTSKSTSKIKKKQRRLIIVANRLPVRKIQIGKDVSWETSPGGLVSALAPFLQQHSGVWVGWTGSHSSAERSFKVNKILHQPVPISAKELNDFYYGFCNATLWPLYHDSVSEPRYHRHWWKPYVEINERFAKATSKLSMNGDLVWVHDYQLQLVPQMLRKYSPKSRIGFFLHIPFPPVELFAHLPWRQRILEGLLGSDVLGFQTEDSVKNFKEAVTRFTDAKVRDSEIRYKGRRILTKEHPITVDVDRYEQAAKKESVISRTKQIKKNLAHKRKIILGIDRLDYTKGIDKRLKAFETLLQQQRISIDDFVFMQVVVPSREKIGAYNDLKTHIEMMVGHLNGEFATAGKVPVQYFHRSLAFEELIAFYKAADLMLVTPLRDGMNLVCKEYICTRTEEDGCLILSEFAGAASELKDSLIINPYDVDGLADSIERGLRLTPAEINARMKKLRQVVKARNVHEWAESFLKHLSA